MKTLKLCKINNMVINKVIKNIANILELGKQKMKILEATFTVGNIYYEMWFTGTTLKQSLE